MNLSSDPQNIYEKVQEWQHMSIASKHCQRRETLPRGHWQASLIKFESFSFSKSPCLKNKGLRETLNNLWTLSYAHTHVQTYTQRQSLHPKPLRAGNQPKKGRWGERERNTKPRMKSVAMKGYCAQRSVDNLFQSRSWFSSYPGGVLSTVIGQSREDR